MNTFVKVGDRVDVYGKPYSKEEHEGSGIVKEVHQGDDESAYVSVHFDDDEIYGYGTCDRWVLPEHVREHKDE